MVGYPSDSLESRYLLYVSMNIRKVSFIKGEILLKHIYI